MLSFHGDPKIKEKYLLRVRAHRLADEIIKGTGWENGKGCAIGCTLENYDHSRYPIELGLPEWSARLEDIIFENFPLENAKLWPENFLESIPVGVDVGPVRDKLAIRRLDRLLKIQKELILNKPKQIEIVIQQTISAIEIVIKCHEAELNKKYCDWTSAMSAAESAAISAAESAGWSTEAAAWSAALSAQRANWFPESAAKSAERAAWSAACSTFTTMSIAESAAWQQEADDLLELLRECK